MRLFAVGGEMKRTYGAILAVGEGPVAVGRRDSESMGGRGLLMILRSIIINCSLTQHDNLNILPRRRR